MFHIRIFLILLLILYNFFLIHDHQLLSDLQFLLFPMSTHQIIPSLHKLRNLLVRSDHQIRLLLLPTFYAEISFDGDNLCTDLVDVRTFL